MAVCTGRRIYRAAQIQPGDDTLRGEVYVVLQPGQNLFLRHFGRVVGIDKKRQRFCYADGVRDLQQAFFRQAGGNNVFGQPAQHIGRGTVHLGGVLAAEGTAAVPGIAAVGIHYDLTAGQSAVAVRSADYETSGRIDEEFGVCIDHVCGQKRRRRAGQSRHKCQQ